MSNPMRTVSFKFPESLDRTLNDLARRKRATRSEIVREAVAALAKDESPSAASLASDLIGSVNGPKDLSANPKHMKGYGE